MAAPKPDLFRIEFVHKARQQFYDCVKVANLVGLREAVNTQVREMQVQLATDPTGWGDPFRRLKHARLRVYRRVMPLMTIIYAVHITANMVWIREVVPTPGSGLDVVGG